MRNLKIFTDGSVNTQLKIGYGAYLLIAEQIPSIDLLQESVKIKSFEDTS
jgi:ribonuclease HI